jgi:phosphohistidine phosphatase SixA
VRSLAGASTAELLAGAGSAAGDLARLRDKFPTCALATFQIELTWAELGPKRAVLEQFQVPRG